MVDKIDTKQMISDIISYMPVFILIKMYIKYIIIY